MLGEFAGYKNKTNNILFSSYSSVFQKFLTDFSEIWGERLSYKRDVWSILQILVDGFTAHYVLPVLEMCQGHNKLVIINIELWQKKQVRSDKEILKDRGYRGPLEWSGPY